MSLLGIDVGTSSVKAAAFSEDGRLLAEQCLPVATAGLGAGAIEGQPAQVRDTVLASLSRIAAEDELRRDPPRALAISASGEEVFPVDAAGDPLGPCLMSADPRGADIEARIAASASPRTWYRRCGHVPERMDPANRIRWWRETHPDIAARASRFLGWHEFLTHQLCGRAATDPSLASKWGVFDRLTGGWSDEGLKLAGFTSAQLPEIAPWHQPIGPLLPAVARRLGLPGNLIVAPGAFDSVAAAIGLGLPQPGRAGLACGTWMVLTAPLAIGPVAQCVIDARLPVVRFPGGASEALLWQSPNGSAVLKWAARLTGQTVATAAAELDAARPTPDRLLATPHLFGAVGLWPEPRQRRGSVTGLGGDTDRVDFVAALLDANACELATAVQLLAGSGVSFDGLRAGGGGTRSAWWMQRIADLTGKPVEVCAQPEPGAFGAALLAGTAICVSSYLAEAAPRLARVWAAFAPAAPDHAERYRRLARFHAVVAAQPVASRPQPPARAAVGEDEIPTPALLVDLDAFEANLGAADAMADAAGKHLRPHFKTHRCPGLALRQRSAVAPGATCATVDEAEALVAAGFTDVLLANEVVGPARCRALAGLAERARVTVAVDAVAPLRALAAAAAWHEVELGVLVDVDVGLDRCGVRTVAAARELALLAAALPGIRFDGLMGYEGRLRASVADRDARSTAAFAALAAAKSEIEATGLAVGVVSAAGTSTLREALAAPVVTEVQAGTYALMEPDLDPLGLPFRCAVRIVGSVISARDGQVVLDVGRRAIGCDGALPQSLDPRAEVMRVNDEHTVLRWSGPPPALGTRISLRPAQNRTTFNLHAQAWLVRDGLLVESLPIARPGALGHSGHAAPWRLLPCA